MSAAPFDVSVIVARLKEAVPSLREVGLAADFASIQSINGFPTPCAYVLLPAEVAVPTVYGQAPRGDKLPVQQFAAVAFSVVIAARNVREQHGGQLNDELRLYLGETRKALMGFVPDVAGGRPCQFVRGDMQDYEAGVGVWADLYQTQHTIQNN